MKTRNRACALILVIVASLSARPLRATTLVRMSLEQLDQASTAVLRGHVVSQESRWNSNHTRIVTYTTLAVAQTLKGSPPATVVVEQLGGTVGNIRLHVSGTIHFHAETDYLLFLEPAHDEPANFLVVGMIQGAYRIFRDAATREERVIRPVLSFSEGPRPGSGVKPSELTRPLGAFQKDVLEALARPEVIPPGTSIPLAIESAEARGVGRMRVLGRTTTSLFPSPAAVIPAGSEIEGTARRVSGQWTIHWTELSIRGVRVGIDARSAEVGALRGRTLVAEVR